jgi:hypothetical protein
MAYPIVPAPYGLKPVNLIGGQVFSGSTRNLPIQYGYATAIFYGDFVSLVRGTVVRSVVTTSASAAAVVGIFLGCYYTSPTTKQRLYSQYYPANVNAGDITAIVADDPDTVFKAVVCSSGTTVASGSIPMIGQNYGMIDNAGNVNTGDSAAALAYSATLTTSTLPLRVVDVVRDTAYSYSAVGSSSTTTITMTTGPNGNVLQGADVGYLASNGQLIETGSFVTAAIAQGATSGTLNVAPAVPGSITAIPSGSTIVYTMYPEVLVKINFGIHEYYTATAV